MESCSFKIRMAAAVVPVRIRRGIVHIERESTTDSGRIVRTHSGNQVKRGGRRFAPYNPTFVKNYALVFLFLGEVSPRPPLPPLTRQQVARKKGRSR